MKTFAGWQRLGDRAPADLVDARLQLHWAAQLVSAVGTTLLPPAADDSHTNLEWLAAAGLLAGRLTTDPVRCRAALRPADLTLLVLDGGDAEVAEHGLHGMTFSQGIVWLEQEIAAFAARPLPKVLRRRALDLPDHPVAWGAPFSTDDAGALAELGRWYVDADAALRTVAEQTPDASAVRCWPHHFDLATLVTVRPSSAHTDARTIGVGMSPGDGSYAQPYWYVTPWPYPEQPQLPALDGGGEWHRTGWTGAVLTGSTLTERVSAADQADQVMAFLRSAVAASRALVGTGA